jgi:hypothetical protein
MNTTPPEYTTIHVWTLTLRALRLIAALTGERMVQVLDRLIIEELRRVQEREKRERGDRGDRAQSLQVQAQADS